MRILVLRVMSWISLFGGALLTPFVDSFLQSQPEQATYTLLFGYSRIVIATTIFVSGVFWWAILGLAANVAEKLLQIDTVESSQRPDTQLP